MNSSTGLPALTSIITRRGRLSLRDHLLDGVRADDLGALGFVGEELVHLVDGAVVGHDGEAVVVHVEDEVLAHDGQADECDIARWLHRYVPPQKCSMAPGRRPAPASGPLRGQRSAGALSILSSPSQSCVKGGDSGDSPEYAAGLGTCMLERNLWPGIVMKSLVGIAALCLLSGAAVAAVPLTNGKIAFASSRDGNFEIYVMNDNGSGQTRLTNNAGEDLNPAWSPDGTPDRLPRATATATARSTS